MAIFFIVPCSPLFHIMVIMLFFGKTRNSNYRPFSLFVNQKRMLFW